MANRQRFAGSSGISTLIFGQMHMPMRQEASRDYKLQVLALENSVLFYRTKK
jgi:hypothetical protein